MTNEVRCIGTGTFTDDKYSELSIGEVVVSDNTGGDAELDALLPRREIFTTWADAYARFLELSPNPRLVVTAIETETYSAVSVAARESDG